MDKLEQAIEILMEEKGYYWDDVCESWQKEENRNFHEQVQHGREEA